MRNTFYKVITVVSKQHTKRNLQFEYSNVNKQLHLRLKSSVTCHQVSNYVAYCLQTTEYFRHQKLGLDARSLFLQC